MDSQQHLFLPSEIARLVLGYLHDVNCKITYKSFLKESKDLAEYSALLKRGITYPTTIMGYTLVNLVNDYGAYKLQENSSSSNALWKQFEGIVKQLKKSAQSKIKQQETQTVRHRRLYKKVKNPKLCTSVLDTKETSDEGWVSDTSPVTEETAHSDDSDRDNGGIPKPSFSKASTSKSSPVLTISDLSSPPHGKVRCKRGKNSAIKTKSRESSRNLSMEIDHYDSQCALEKTPENFFKRTLRSSSTKKRSNSSGSEKETKEKQDISCADSSVNSILVINEDEPKAPSERLDTSEIQSCDNTSEFQTHDITERIELDTIYEASNPCSDDANVNNSNFCDVSMRCNGNHEVEKGDDNVNQTPNETFIVHSIEIHREAFQENNADVVQNFPPPVTPQKSAFRPINVDENSNLKTPVKTLSNVHFDHHYKSPRRKRPPRRRADNNITVMGGFSPDNSTCTQLSTHPPGPEVDENTMTEYANMIDKLLEDTKLHEKLADNINKKLVPIKDNVLMKNGVSIRNSVSLSSIAVHSEPSMTTVNMPSTSAVDVNTNEHHDAIQPYMNEHHDIPTGTDNFSNDNLTSMLGGVIKGIADVTGNDPSFESLFSLFMNVKESSVHDEVDQMIIQSNQDDIQNNQTDELHTPTDIKENFLVNPDDQHQLEQHPLSSVYLKQNSNQSQNQFNCNNSASIVNNSNDPQVQPASKSYQTPLSSESDKCSVYTSNNSSPAQTIVCNTGNSSQKVNRPSHPVPIAVNSNSNSQSASNQECSMYNVPVASIHSPALSVISINSPDANSLSTPDRTTKTRRPKRITPTPLNGTEILPLHGKIASPQKPLIIIPENKQLNSGKHFPPPNSNSRNSHYSEGHSDNSQHSTVELTTPLQSTLINFGYPQVNQSQLNETSVSDITLSPGGHHLLAHNKRSMAKAIEENRAFVLSPITPINENTKLASSTPYPNSIPACSLSESSGKTPKKEFKKPNSKTVSRDSHKTEDSSSRADDDENSVLCYSLSPLKSDANVIHGTVDDVPFTAVPMGQLSKRFCHVRNLDFGREQQSSNDIPVVRKRRPSTKSAKSDSKPKKVLPKKISTPHQTTTKSFIKIQPKPTATIVNPETDNVSTKSQLIQMSPQVLLEKLENKQKPKEKRKSADKVKTPKTSTTKTPLTKTSTAKAPSTKTSTAKAPSTKTSTTKVPSTKTSTTKTPSTKIPNKTTESLPKKEKAKPKRKSDPKMTKKASPRKNSKVKSSSRKKNATPKKKPPPAATNVIEEKNLVKVKVNAPVDAIDILDADTKEFNQCLEDVNVINYEIPLDLSAGSTNSQINIVSVNEVSNQFVTLEQQNETKAAAEVLASLSNSFGSFSKDSFKPSSLSTEEVQDTDIQRNLSWTNQPGVASVTKISSNIQSEPTDLSVPKETAVLPVTQSSVIASANVISGKRKAEDSMSDSISSADFCLEPKKKKMKKKKSIDLRSVNIDALLSKVKYAK